MFITEFYGSFVGFRRDVGSEMLGKNCFSSAYIASYDNALRHPLWITRNEAEELHQQAMFFFSMRQLLRNVVYVKLAFVFEYALM